MGTSGPRQQGLGASRGMDGQEEFSPKSLSASHHFSKDTAQPHKPKLHIFSLDKPTLLSVYKRNKEELILDLMESSWEEMLILPFLSDQNSNVT